MNVNEIMKAPQDLNTNKDKLKQFGGPIITSFELDPKISLTHVSGRDNIDHVLNKFPCDAKGWVDNATAHLLNVFHVSSK